MNRLTVCVLLCLSLVVTAVGVRAADNEETTVSRDETARKLKKIVDTIGPSLVIIRAEVTINFGGRGGNSENIEVVGVAFSENSVVVSSMSINGTEALESVYGPGLKAMLAGQLSVTVGNISLLDDDGEEHDAQVDHDDEATGLTLITLTDDEMKLKPLERSRIASVETGDGLVTVGRLDETFGYAAFFDTCRIAATVEKPSVLYVIEKPKTGLGSPVFTTDGQFVGLVTRILAEDEEAKNVGGAANLTLLGRTDRLKDIVTVVPAAALKQLATANK